MAASVTTGLSLYYFGLKYSLVMSFALAACGMLCLTFIDTLNQLLLALFILGSKYGVSQVFNMAYLGNVRIFPTSLVNPDLKRQYSIPSTKSIIKAVS